MNSSLERLADLVRQAEVKSRSHKLIDEIRQAAERLRAADERLRAVERRSREVRPVRQRELERADADEHSLKELIRKLAQLKSSLESDQDVETLVDAARAEIENRRREAKAELDAITRETDETRKELQTTLEPYQQLRRELERLQPHFAADFATEDRIVADAERFFPAGQIQALVREIEDGEAHFGMLDARQQYAQLRIWIGRYRRIQASDQSAFAEADVELLQRTFPRLVGISKQYEPGYIEAFRKEFTADWDAYIADAREQLRLATDAARRNRDLEPRRHEQPRLR